MKRLGEKYFFLGLLVFYLVIFFAPNKPVYFSAYFISTFFFYLATKNFPLSLVFSLILAFFADITLVNSWFMLEPLFLNLGSGYGISPITVIILPLLAFSFGRNIKPFHNADLAIALFFFWSFVFFLFFPQTNNAYGLFSLGEIILAYYLLRIHLSKNHLHLLWYLLISMILFQSGISFLQLILRGNVGITAESSSLAYPFGLTIPGETDFFRVTGTYGHANFLASFLVALYPFILLYQSRRFIFQALKIMPLVILFFTFSRSSWFAFLLLILLALWQKKSISLKVSKSLFQQLIIGLFFLFIFIVLVSHYLLFRLESIPQAFTESGSMNIRLKLITEAFNLISSYPITGVGLNFANLAYAYMPSTDILSLVFPSKFYSIHNAFLEIAVETGLVGVLLFSLFIILAVKNYLWQKNYIKDKSIYFFKEASLLGLLALIVISMFHPFFHSTQFRLFFLFVSILLV